MPVDIIHFIIWFSLVYSLVEVSAWHIQFALEQINTNEKISSMCNWEIIADSVCNSEVNWMALGNDIVSLYFLLYMNEQSANEVNASRF